MRRSTQLLFVCKRLPTFKIASCTILILCYRYSSAIETAPTFDKKQVAYLQHALANLSFGRPAKALDDATLSCNISEPHEKSLSLQATALYALHRFKECEETIQVLIKSFPNNDMAKKDMLRAKARRNEQQKGEYSFTDMYEQAKKTPPIIDSSTYSVP
jgi:hypothetical protein